MNKQISFFDAQICNPTIIIGERFPSDSPLLPQTIMKNQINGILAYARFILNSHAFKLYLL